MPHGRLHWWIFAGLLLGAAGGLAANALAARPVTEAVDPRDVDRNGIDDRLDWATVNIADPLGRVFLRLIFMVVLPLVVSALLLGVYGIGDLRHLGRLGLRTIGLTVLLSGAAVFIGISLVNTIRPGGGLSAGQRDLLRAQYAPKAQDTLEKARKAKPLRDTLLDLLPENPLQEMVGAVDGSSKGNGMLAVMFFALIFGAALTQVDPPKAEAVVRVAEGVFDASMVVIGFAMRLAPVAVACLLFSVTARLGGDVLRSLLWFIVTGLLAMALQMVVVYPVVLRTVGRTSPVEFFRRIPEVIVTAFGTSSSNATLPTALRVAEEELGLPRRIARFVLTVGATGNQNGTALYEGVVVLFLAQVFGVHLTWGEQLTVVLMAILAGVGTAGVPGGSLPLIAILLQTVRVPAEGIAIIIGVDRILDMARTVVNVTGDLVLATCVSRGEPE